MASPRRIMILGGPGSGKSTLAVELGRVLSLPVHHLDAHYWLPGWKERAPDDFDGIVSSLASSDSWILDGNYRRSWPQRLERADAVVFLDISTKIRMMRILNRTWQHRGRERKSLARGCPERFSLAFLLYALRWGGRRRDQCVEVCERPDIVDRSLVVTENMSADAIARRLSDRPASPS